MSPPTIRAQKPRWCLFTSAGDKNAISVWLRSCEQQRRWDLVVAYYGNDELVFSELSANCSYVFRTKGSKFQNLRRLLTEQPHFFNAYSHVWVCDDDIVMSAADIDEAFSLSETLGFWIAQPSVSPAGRNSHWITLSAAPQWDYRIVNFVELGMPIFRREKLIEFMAVYDGSLTGWGIDYWFGNIFEADAFGRFAILDKVQVINPRNADKGESEIDRLQAAHVRRAAWQEVQMRSGLSQYEPKVYSYCKLPPECEPRVEQLSTRRRGWNRERVLAVLGTLKRRGWRDAMWLLKCTGIMGRQRRGTNSL